MPPRLQWDEEEALLPLLNRQVLLEHQSLKTGLDLKKDNEGEEGASPTGQPLPVVGAGLQESAEEGADPGNEALSLLTGKGASLTDKGGWKLKAPPWALLEIMPKLPIPRDFLPLKERPP